MSSYAFLNKYITTVFSRANKQQINRNGNSFLLCNNMHLIFYHVSLNMLYVLRQLRNATEFHKIRMTTISVCKYKLFIAALKVNVRLSISNAICLYFLFFENRRLKDGSKRSLQSKNFIKTFTET